MNRALIKGIIKPSVKTAAMYAGFIFRERGQCSRILTYHSVGCRGHEMNVSTADFRSQMEWLKANCTVLPLSDAAAAKSGIALTFDDGYADNIDNAAPILAELGLPATVFVVAGRVGGRLEHDTDHENSALMTWEEIIRLHEMGIEIGAHTMNHRRLSQLGEDEQRQEIEQSKHTIEDRIGHEVKVFAYPFGSAADYDDTSIRLTKDAGFEYALSNRYGVNKPGQDPFALKRIWIDSTDTLTTFKAKVQGRLDALTLLDSSIGTFLRRLLNK